MNSSAYDTNGKRKYLNPSENERFLEAVGSQPSDRATFCLMIYFSGCRISEALNLTRSSIDFEVGVVVLKTLKKRNRCVHRRIPLPEPVMKRLDELCGAPTDRLWSFSRTTGWRIVKEVMGIAEIVGTQATTKGLRHSFGVRSAMNHVPMNVISGWMGHADFSTTAIYLDVRGEEERELIQRTWEGPFENRKLRQSKELKKKAAPSATLNQGFGRERLLAT